MAGLKLQEFIPEDDVIEKGDRKVFVTANISRDLLLEFFELRDIDAQNVKKEDMVKMDETFIKVLLAHPRNKEAEVRAFMKALSFKEYSQVIIFISNYFTNSVQADVPEGKKKEG